MKIVFDKFGREFRLGERRATDTNRVYATRKDIRTAIEKVRENPFYVYLPTHFLETGSVLDVTVEINRGLLRLGCHKFSRKVSRQIIRWA